VEVVGVSAFAFAVVVGPWLVVVVAFF